MSKKLILVFILLLSSKLIFAQHENLDRITDSIVNEGKILYRSEWASWYGTDVFMEKCPQKRVLSGGYLSYETNKNLVNIFFSKDAEPIVLASISFAKDFNSHNYILDTIPRKLNKTEQSYYSIRMRALKRVNSDTTFKYYKNTTLNPVPIIQNGVKKVYVLTGTNANGVVIFGNDYLINFNTDDEVESVKRLHKNIIPIYIKTDTAKTTVASMHSHLPETGDFITATDICTLMLYEKLTPWTQHYVISKKDISIWDCKKDILVILTMEAWKRIQEDQKTRHPGQ